MLESMVKIRIYVMLLSKVFKVYPLIPFTLMHRDGLIRNSVWDSACFLGGHKEKKKQANTAHIHFHLSQILYAIKPPIT